jgi:hypothetical protein
MSAACRSVFVVGAQRSGTTWLQRLLLEDPRCCGGQESHFFATFGRVLHEFDHKASLPRPHGLAGYWTRTDLVAEIRGLWQRTTAPLRERHPAAAWLVEKTPDHALCMDTIAEVVPDARFIHIVRDSRAVVASLLRASREPWGRGWAPGTAAAAADRWLAHVRAAEDFGAAAGPDRFLRLRYEDLLAGTAAELRRAFDFLDLEIDDARLAEFADRQRFDRQATRGGSAFESTGALGPATPPEPEGFFGRGTADAWRGELSPLARRTVWRRTGRLMRDLGYDR